MTDLLVNVTSRRDVMALLYLETAETNLIHALGKYIQASSRRSRANTTVSNSFFRKVHKAFDSLVRQQTYKSSSLLNFDFFVQYLWETFFAAGSHYWHAHRLKASSKSNEDRGREEIDWRWSYCYSYWSHWNIGCETTSWWSTRSQADSGNWVRSVARLGRCRTGFVGSWQLRWRRGIFIKVGGRALRCFIQSRIHYIQW